MKNIRMIIIMLLSLFIGGCSTKDNNFFTNEKYREELERNYERQHSTYEAIVISNELIEMKKGGTGGTIIGSIVGGVIGSQFGSNTGKLIMISTGVMSGGTIGYLLSQDKVVQQKIKVKTKSGHILNVFAPISYEQPEKDIYEINEIVTVRMKRNSNIVGSIKRFKY